ncbi:MAG TPA: hypothetical protein VLU96_06950 [Gaiellaceae bacterium]|nr:hypothetical protein [Gaiellaceae bacterium]
MTDYLCQLRNELRLDEPLSAPEAARDRAYARLEALMATKVGAGHRVPRRRAALGLALLIAVLIGVFAIAWTTVQPFGLHLFSGSHGPRISETAREAFALEPRSPTGTIDLDTIEPAGSFTLPQGQVTVYVARTRTGVGWATVYETGSGRVVTGCSTRLSPEFLPFSSSGCTPRDTLPGVSEISGLAEPPVASVTLTFEDGQKLLLPLHHGVFVYLQGGERCERGHRPALLVARTAEGEELGRTEGPFDC